MLLGVKFYSFIQHTVGLGDAIHNLRHLYTFCVGCPCQTSPVETSSTANVSKHVISRIFRVKYNGLLPNVIYCDVGLEVVILIMIGVSVSL